MLPREVWGGGTKRSCSKSWLWTPSNTYIASLTGILDEQLLITDIVERETELAIKVWYRSQNKPRAPQTNCKRGSAVQNLLRFWSFSAL